MLSALLAVLFAPAPVEPPTGPPGDPPLLAVARVAPDGSIRISQTLVVPATETRYRNVVVGGVVRVEPYSVTVYRHALSEYVAPDAGKYATVAGKVIDRKDLPKFLSEPTPIAICHDGKGVSAEYRALFQANTIVLLYPPPARRPVPLPKGGPAKEPR